MEGIKRAIDKYAGELTGMRVDLLEQEFGKESFNAELLDHVGSRKLGCTVYANYKVILGQITGAMARNDNFAELTTPRFTQGEVDHIRMITLAIYSDERTYIYTLQRIDFELDRLIPEELRRKEFIKIIDRYGLDLYDITIDQIEKGDWRYSAFKWYVLRDAAETFGLPTEDCSLKQLLEVAAVKYHSLPVLLTAEQADHLQLIIRIFVDTIVPELKQFL